jgi:2-dehydro-3-deoxyphosphogluconate aldolase/(4S)-4-hydroxy-2-oxoglutarate aldolase
LRDEKDFFDRINGISRIRSSLMKIIERIEKARIIPIVSLEKAEDAIPLCSALNAGGLQVVEITFRTAAASEALRIVKKEFPGFLLGSGTITTLKELEGCVSAGAEFAVAPGLNPAIVKRAGEMGFPFFPGVCTPTEVDAALEIGCTILKFFPSEIMGGVKMLSAIYAPFKHRGVRFIPTGGINAKNLKDYLSLPCVLAIGGSWLVEKSLIQDKAWNRITELTREAVNT